MKKAIVTLLIAGLVGVAGPVKAVSEEEKTSQKEGTATSQAGRDGARIFQERGCGACHDATKDQSIYGLGPSMEQIAEAYKGREEELTRFLKGGCGPIMDEERFYPTMHGEIVKLKDLSDAEIKELQKHICGQE